MSKKNLFKIVNANKHMFAFEHLDDYEQEKEKLKGLEVTSEGLLDIFKSKPKVTPDEAGIKLIKTTYLNDEWLDEQKFNTGNFKYGWKHLLKKDLNSALSDVTNLYTNSVKENEKILKDFNSRMEPIKKYVLSNPEDFSKEMEKKINELPPTTLVNPEDKITEQELPLANRENIKDAANVLIKAIQLKGIDARIIFKALDQISIDWYDANSLRRNVKNKDLAISLIGIERDKLPDMGGKVWDYMDKDGFELFKNATLVRPLIKYLKDSIK